MEKNYNNMKNILTFDTETSGLVPKGLNYKEHYNQFPHIVQLAWEFNGVMKNYIIKPDGYTIPKGAADIHGITTEIALRDGVNIKYAVLEFFADCYKAEKIVGHNIYFDTSIIKANCRRIDLDQDSIVAIDAALDKSKRIDTMMKTIKFCGIKQKDSNRLKFPTLVELHYKLFNESFPAHDAKFDVLATKRCFDELVKRGVINL
jgi:DNA polymerase-3 subunit alpha